MSTLAMAKKVASKFNATLVDNKCGNTHECCIEAPSGYIWSSDFIHEMIDSSYRPWKPDYQSLIVRMNYGVEKCEDVDCEWCNPENL